MDLELHRIAHPKKAAFLRAFTESGSILRACRLAGVARRSHYYWLQDDPEYVEAFADAQAEAIDNLQGEAHRRAVEGVRRMRFHQGKPIIDPQTGQPYIEHEYSDALLIFLLKANMPEKFCDRAMGSARTSTDGPETEPSGGRVDPDRTAELERYYELFIEAAESRHGE